MVWRTIFCPVFLFLALNFRMKKSKIRCWWLTQYKFKFDMHTNQFFDCGLRVDVFECFWWTPMNKCVRCLNKIRWLWRRNCNQTLHAAFNARKKHRIDILLIENHEALWRNVAVKSVMWKVCLIRFIRHNVWFVWNKQICLSVSYKLFRVDEIENGNKIRKMLLFCPGRCGI